MQAPRPKGFDVSDAVTSGAEARLLNALDRRFEEQKTDAELIAASVPTSGWLHDYVEWAKPCTEAPVLFHLVCGLSCLSAAVGRRAHVQVGSARLFGNTFIALVGSQGIVRKSTALGLASGLISEAFPELVFAGDATPEALQQHVLSKAPERLLLVDELSTVLGAPDYARQLRRVLATLHDCPERLEWARMGKGDGSIERPTVSVLGGSTFSWLAETTGAADVRGGILSRFMWAVASHDGRLLPLPPAPDQGLRERLRDGLRNLREGLDADSRQLGMDDARQEHSDFYTRIMRRAEKEQEDSLGGVIARLASAHGPKLALLMTLAGDPTARQVSARIYQQHVFPLVDALERGMRLVVHGMAESEEDRLEASALCRIQQVGSEGITRRDLLRALHTQKRLLAPVLETLFAKELVAAVRVGRTERLRALE